MSNTGVEETLGNKSHLSLGLCMDSSLPPPLFCQRIVALDILPTTHSL